MTPAVRRARPAGVQPAPAEARRAAAPFTQRPQVPSRMPPHPGRFLETRFLTPLGITQSELATALGVSRRRINELVRGRRAITPDTALRLALHFGNDAAFWLQLQLAWDLYVAARKADAPRLARR